MAAQTPQQSAHGSAVGWRPWALLLCVGPWTVFMLWSAAPQVWGSVLGFEKFPETLTPGYFLVKLALLLMLLLVLVEALTRVLPASWRQRRGKPPNDRRNP